MKNIKINGILTLIITLAISILLVYTYKIDFYDRGEELTISSLNKKSEISNSTEVIVKSVYVNDILIPIDNISGDNLLYKDDLLYFLSTGTSSISFKLPENSTYRINFVKHNYSGIVSIKAGNEESKVDLYSEEQKLYDYYGKSNNLTSSNVSMICTSLTIFVILLVICGLSNRHKFGKYLIPILICTLFCVINKCISKRVILYCFALYLPIGIYVCRKEDNNYINSISIILYLLIINFIVPLNFKYSELSNFTAFLVTNIFWISMITITIYSIKSFCINYIRDKSNQKKMWLIFFLIILGINLIALLLTWPGNWVWDEKSILQCAMNYVYSDFQSYLSVLLYSFSLIIIPYLFGIEIIQIILISIISGYICSKVYDKIKNKRLIIILLLIFILPPILMNNLYPLRSSIYSFLELLFIFKIFDIYKNKHKLDSSTLIVLSLLIVILSFWRSEGIYYILFGVLVVLIVLKKQLSKNKILFFVKSLVISIIIVSPFILMRDMVSTTYELTIYANPLSNMLNDGITLTKEEEKTISKVYNIDVLKKYSSYTECPSLYNGGIVDGYKNNMKEFKKTYIKLVLKNPIKFISARMKTFLATTGLDDEFVANSPWDMFENYTDATDSEVKELVFHDNLSKPFNVEFRNKVVHFLKGTEGLTTKYSLFGKLFWNFLPSIIFMLILFFYLLFKKKWNYLLIVILPLIKVPLVFITAPANYFFYYLPIYIIGLIAAGYLIISHFDKRKVKNEKK